MASIVQQVKWLYSQVKCLVRDIAAIVLDTNNIIIEVELFSDFSGTDVEQLVAVINDSNGFTVEDNEIYLFTIHPEEETSTSKFLFKVGKGTFGNGGVAVTESNFAEVTGAKNLSTFVNDGDGTFPFITGVITSDTDFPSGGNGYNVVDFTTTHLSAYEEELEFIQHVGDDVVVLSLAQAFKDKIFLPLDVVETIIDVVASARQAISVDTTAGDITITLPSSPTMKGKTIDIIKNDASINQVIVSPVGGQLINGIASGNLTAQWDNITLLSMGTYWIIK